MKVILLKDVPKIGKKYEVKEVSDGYGSNFLLPQRLAEVASNSSLKKIEIMREAEAVSKQIQEDLLLKNISSLESAVVTMDEKANAKRHLFAGIHKDELVKALKEQTELDILPEFINLEKPIKEAGEHTINVSVRDKKATFKLIVNATK
jgi:large subunit ribosomal protein L9